MKFLERRFFKNKFFLTLLFSLILLLLINNLFSEKKGKTYVNLHNTNENKNEYLFNCNGKCGKNQNCLFGKCFCKPPYSGEKCMDKRTSPVLLNPDGCPTISDRTQIKDLNFTSYKNGCKTGGVYANSGEDCATACFWQSETGITQIPKKLWTKVLENEFNHHTSAKAVKNSRTNENVFSEPTTRWLEFQEGFKNWESLSNQNLGSILEIGAGPYTQILNLLKKNPTINFRKIYLEEPNIFNYLNLDTCTYHDGKLNGENVNLLSMPIEELAEEGFQFDTIIVTNVVEHTFDAFKFLISIYKVLKPEGILIFHERYFPTIDGPETTVLGLPTLHPIRITQVVLLTFFNAFEKIYISDIDNNSFVRKRGFNEKGYFYIGRKKI